MLAVDSTFVARIDLGCNILYQVINNSVLFWKMLRLLFFFLSSETAFSDQKTSSRPKDGRKYYRPKDFFDTFMIVRVSLTFRSLRKPFATHPRLPKARQMTLLKIFRLTDCAQDRMK